MLYCESRRASVGMSLPWRVNRSAMPCRVRSRLISPRYSRPRRAAAIGRRRIEDTDADKVTAIVAARAKGAGIRRIAREFGVGVGTVLRLTEGVLSLCSPHKQGNSYATKP
jgi:hypothetical protein